MAQQQQNLHVSAPAFQGLNTQDSPVGLGMEWAAVADNCVIDKFGRIACREGLYGQTTNPSVLGGQPLAVSFVFLTDSGFRYVLCAGNNKIFTSPTNGGDLVELTLPVGYPGITDDNWQFTQLNNVVYLVQANHQPLKFDPATPTELLDWTEAPTDIAGLTGAGVPNTITSGYGRVFCGAFGARPSLITWSNLLDGDGYTIAQDSASDSGYYDLEEFWPYGHDTVIGIRVHNNFLVVWGKESILIYNIPETGPVFGVLSDTIEGIGLAARDTIQPIGADIFFLDYSGVRSLSRTIQEKSVPIGDVSANVRDDVVQLIRNTDIRVIRSVFDAENSFYAVFFPEGIISNTVVFDTRGKLEGGAHRATRWPKVEIHSASAFPNGKVVYTGLGGLYEYQNANDSRIEDDDTTRTTDSIPMEYQTHPQTWDQPANLKFPKQVDVTVIGGQNFQLCLDWAYDYSPSFNSGICKLIDRGAVYEYNIDEYGVAEYSGSLTLLGTEQFNVWGNGRNVKYRFSADVSGTTLSFQEINIQTLLGRIT